MELTAWVERTRSERGVAIIGIGDDPSTRMGPPKASRNLRYVLSQNIPEPGVEPDAHSQRSGMVKGLACETRLKVEPNAKWKCRIELVKLDCRIPYLG